MNDRRGSPPHVSDLQARLLRQLLSGGENMCELVEGAFEEGRSLTTSMVIFLRDEPQALLAATAAITQGSLAILDVTSRITAASTRHAATGAFQFRVQLSSVSQMEELMTALNELPQVLSVQRDTLEMMREESAQLFWRDEYGGAL